MRSLSACIILLISVSLNLYSETEYITVGITPFSGKKEDIEKSRLLVSGISAWLGKYRFIRLVDRSKLEEIANEIEFGMSGPGDESTAVRAGKIHGAQVIITGSMRDGMISARAIHIGTSKIIADHSVPYVSGSENLSGALARGIEVFLVRENLKKMRNDTRDIVLDFRIAHPKNTGSGLTEITQATKNGSLKIGETASFRARSNKSGYLTIIDIQPSGDVVILFPNDMFPSGKIDAGRWYSIPAVNDTFEIRIAEPAGRDTVMAFFALAKVDWPDRGMLEGTGFRQVKDDQKLSLTRGLKAVSKGLKSSEWESSVIELDVVK